MLEPLIVSTRACDLITEKLGLVQFRKGTGTFGITTPRKNLLVIGDVDSDFLDALTRFAVKVTLIRTVPRTWDKPSRDVRITELVGVKQIESVDSHQFSLLLLADPAAVGKDCHFHLWRVLEGSAKCVAWVPAYMTNPIDDSVVRLLGAHSSEVISLSDYDCPGNYLHYFETRKDQSEFHQT